jgi:hypothetical protein
MKELIDAGLFGRGLITVDSPRLIGRYNAALSHLGLPETKCAVIQIDRLGWSPEVSAQMGSDYYLSHGVANPLAIILTPLQASAPIYFPHHSFDWRLMAQWFTTRGPHISDLTKDTAVCLDIDQEVDLYHSPADLLMVDEVMVRVSTPSGLMEEAIVQKELVARFLREEGSHHDPVLITKIEESAKRTGDLRHRSLTPRDMQFTDVVDFYSRALGGIFVLRSHNTHPLVYTRDPVWADGELVHVATPHIVSQLAVHGYIHDDMEWWRAHLHRLRIIAESFLMDVLDEEMPDGVFLSLSLSKQKGIIHRYASKLGAYQEFLRLIHAIQRKEALPHIAQELRIHLLHPADDLQAHSREVIWQLLTYIQGGRMVPLFYRHQKTAFVSAYRTTWQVPKREWALKRVRDHYDWASKSSNVAP